MSSILNFNDLTGMLARTHGRKRVAVASPADSHTEYVVERALNEGIADFVLVCVGECRPEFAALRDRFAGHVTVETEPDVDSAARRAVAIVREGGADVLMKGSMNTDNLLRAVLNKEHGILEPGRVLSHVTVTQIPAYGKLLVFSDAAVVPRPTLDQFDAILGYAVGVSRRLGVSRPAVALVNFTEKVNEKFPHTLYYEELKHRASEGRYGDVCVDGPMDVKTALDAESGKITNKTDNTGYNFATASQPLIQGNIAYITTADKGVVAYDLSTKQILWNTPTGKSMVYTACYTSGDSQTVDGRILESNGALLFGASDGNAYKLDPQSGTVLNTITVGVPVLATLASDGTALYAAGFTGGIYRVSNL